MLVAWVDATLGRRGVARWQEKVGAIVSFFAVVIVVCLGFASMIVHPKFNDAVAIKNFGPAMCCHL